LPACPQAPSRRPESGRILSKRAGLCQRPGVRIAARPRCYVRHTMIVAAWPWEWSPSAWAALTFFALAVAAFVAWRQVKEAQRLREEQARPFVIIDFHAFQTIAELTITNIGATLARNVTFKFTPPLVTTHDNSPGGRGNLMNLNIFKNGIPSLPPNKQMKLFFDQFPARIQAELPLTY